MTEAPRASPRVSVIVTTLQRPQDLPVAIGSILRCRHDSFELLLADQNAQDQTLEQLGEMALDPRLRRIRMEPVGLSQAQNFCAAEARGDILLITDDDCEVQPDWISRVETAFSKFPEAGVLIGNVLAAPHDAAAGFIPSVRRPAERIWTSPWQKPELEVMGACMAIRRSAWHALCGFPPSIGPGAKLKSGGDYDLVLRALMQGIPVLECPNVYVVHHGFRNWTQAQELLENYAFGTALVLALRTAPNPLLFLRSLLAFWRSYVEGRSTVVASAQIHNSRVQPRRIRSFVRGLSKGMLLAVRPDDEVNPA